MVDNVDDFLAHFGVRGMKWGKRSTKRSERQKADDEIKDARFRQKTRQIDVRRAVNRLESATTAKGERAAQKAFNKIHDTYLTHPDAETARKVTSGERVANRLTLGVTLAAAGLLIPVGLVATNEAIKSRNRN